MLALAACAAAGTRAPGDTAAPLRVMSFNIRYGTADDGPNAWPLRRELVHATVERADADILGVQEALRFQLDELLARAPAYQRVGVGRDDGVDAGEFSAILYRASRLAVAEQGTFWLSDSPEVPGSMHWGNRITRIATWARFLDRRSGDSLLVLNTHWDHESQPSRERSAALIRDWLAGHAAGLPVLVMGDFNAGEQNPAFRALVADTGPAPRLRDTWRARHPYGPEQGTFHGFRGGADSEKIDAILVSAGWQVLEAAIDSAGSAGRYPSDHHPVTATVVRQE